MKDIEKRFPDELNEINSDYPNDKDLLFWYYICLSNLQLVKYYERLGFRIITEKRCTGVAMLSKNKNVLYEINKMIYGSL